MNYKEKLNYLKLTEREFTGRQIPEDINRRYSLIKNEVLEFESNVFNILFNSIMNEKTQLEFLNSQKESHPRDELFQKYLDNEILKHQYNIKLYGDQILSLYSRDTIINIFEKRKNACQERIDYCNNNLKTKPDDKALLISLRYDQENLNKLNNVLSILKGFTPEMVDCYVDVSQERQKL